METVNPTCDLLMQMFQENRIFNQSLNIEYYINKIIYKLLFCFESVEIKYRQFEKKTIPTLKWHFCII